MEQIDGQRSICRHPIPRIPCWLTLGVDSVCGLQLELDGQLGFGRVEGVARENEH